MMIKILPIILMISFLDCETGDKAEKNIQLESIMPMVRLDPFPSAGNVKTNSPYFIWPPVIKEKVGVNTYQFDENYLYRIRISQDPGFNGSTTIESEKQEWTFFNPHEKLGMGTWYWQYASEHMKTGEISWSDPIEFNISGKEREFVTPTPGIFIDKIPRSHPRFLSTRENIGSTTFPDEMKNTFLEKYSNMIGEKLPETLIYNDRKVLDEKQKTLSPKNYNRYIDKATKEKYSPQMEKARNFLKAYLISGDKKFADEALRRYYYLKAQYFNIVDKGYYNDFTDGYFLTISSGIYDVLHDRIEEGERNEIEERLVKKQKETYHHFLHHAGLELMNSHMWQHHMRNFFTTSIILAHHIPEAEKWIAYVYDLWTFRAPVGSIDDGGWIAGNGYFQTNSESLFVMPFLLSNYTGVNYFNLPWYEGFAAYLLYASPVAHISGGFGDNADIKREPTSPLLAAINKIKPTVYSRNYMELSDKYGTGYMQSRQNIERGGDIFWFQNQPFPFSTEDVHQEVIDLAKDFRDAGIVAMHTDIEDPLKNLMVSFRSCPYGVAGHAHAAQNAFNIQYGGYPLFFRTGYYSSWADHHSLQSYRHTRAHNSILADGMGQVYYPEGYGWIPRFVTGDLISYASGDASQAYNGLVARDEYIRECKRWKVDLTPENGFGNPGVTRFKRHLLMLRPDIIIVYDELEAEKPLTWSWLIHSKDTLAVVNPNQFYTENKLGKGLLTLYCNDYFTSTVTDQFYAPAVDWLGNGAKKGIDYINQWHGKAETAKSDRSRFLGIIQVAENNETGSFSPINMSEGKYVIGDWQIEVELDPTKPASFLVYNLIESAGISLEKKGLNINGKQYKHRIPGSALLVDSEDGESIVKEAVDQLPSAAIYY